MGDPGETTATSESISQNLLPHHSHGHVGHGHLFHHDIGLLEQQIQGEVSTFRELLLKLDPELEPQEHESLVAQITFLATKTRENVADLLEGETNTVIIQQRIQEARADFMNTSFELIFKYYSTSKPHLVELLKTLRKLYRVYPEVEAAESGMESRARDRSLKKEDFGKPRRQITKDDLRPSNVRRVMHRTVLRSAWWVQLLYTYIPILSWGPKYFEGGITNFSFDAICALTIASVVVPQGMSYAGIAQLPSIYGLYTAFLPPALYAIFGTSNELSVGPVAMVSLIIPSVAGTLASPKDTNNYVAAVLLMTFLSGILYLIAAMLRLGFLIENLLSNPVLVGFTSGAAVLIISGQFKNITRVPIESTAKTFVDYCNSFFSQIDQFHGYTFLIGISCIIIIIACRKYDRRIPAAFIMLVVTTFLVWITKANTKAGIKIVGVIPSGLPSPSFPAKSLTWSTLMSILPNVVILSVLGYFESISVSKKFASKRHYQVNANQELVALGVANLFSSFFKAYPSTGSLSRTSESYFTAVKTPMAGIFLCIILGAVLLFVTPAFEYTPQACLGAVVISSAFYMIDYEEIMFLWKLGDLIDFGQVIFVFIITLLLGPEFGVGSAILISLLVLIYRTCQPPFVRLGRLPKTLVYKDCTRFPEVELPKEILVLRFDARLFFGNSLWFSEWLYKFENQFTADGNILHAIVIDCSGVNSIDSTAVHTMSECITNFKRRNVMFVLSATKGAVRDTLEVSGLAEMIGYENFFLTTHDAVVYLEDYLRSRPAAMKMDEPEKVETEENLWNRVRVRLPHWLRFGRE